MLIPTIRLRLDRGCGYGDGMKTIISSYTGLLLAFAMAGEVSTASAQAVSAGSPLPAFTHPEAADWLNSPPLTVANLRGSVVLVDFWALDCWNCDRTIPWLNALGDRYGKRGLIVISVHTPELEAERVRENVVDAVRRYKISNPVMIDNDYSYWSALGTRAWPTFFVADRNGRLRLESVGEVHIGDEHARSIEGQIEQLLAEKPDPR